MSTITEQKIADNQSIYGDKIYLLGGFDGDHPTADVQEYNVTTQKLTKVHSLSKPRTQFPTVTLPDGRIWFGGGGNGTVGGWLDTCEIYDPKTGKSHNAAKLSGKRQYHTCVYFHGKVWSIGGFDGENMLTNVELYDPIADKWEKGVPLPKGRGGAGSVVFNNKIYVFGGTNEQYNSMASFDSSTIVFDPSTNSWTTLQGKLNFERKYVQGRVFNGKILALSGANALKYASAVEEYDVEKDTWTIVSNFNFARQSCAIGVAQNKIFIFGGYLGGEGYLDSMEVFDGDKPEQGWVKTDGVLHPRPLAGCAGAS